MYTSQSKLNESNFKTTVIHANIASTSRTNTVRAGYTQTMKLVTSFDKPKIDCNDKSAKGNLQMPSNEPISQAQIS